MLWRNCAFCDGRHRRKMVGWLAGYKVRLARDASAKDELLEMTKKSSAWPKQLEAVAYRFAKAWTAVKGGVRTLLWVLLVIAIFLSLRGLFLRM